MIRTTYLAIAASCLAAWMVSAEDIGNPPVDSDDAKSEITILIGGVSSPVTEDHVIDGDEPEPICDANVVDNDEDRTVIADRDAALPEACPEPDVLLSTGASVVVRYVDGPNLCRSCVHDRSNRSCTIVQNIVCVGVSGDRTSVSIYVEGGFNLLDSLTLPAD